MQLGPPNLAGQLAKVIMASGKIFIKYRREDSRGDAGRLFDRLKARFSGQVFMDVSTIESGVDFGEAIERAVGSCVACVVVIGKHWLIDETGRRRLDKPEDFVRLEIATALKRNIRVIPVLVSGATMPSPGWFGRSLETRICKH